MIVPVILCGGSGTRLWPLSRNSYPKQLLPLVNDQTMLQNTILRVMDFSAVTTHPVIICNEAHRFLVAEQMQEINISQATIMLEPVGRNTAPAVTVAALQMLLEKRDPLMLVLPADHSINNVKEFKEAILQAALIADQGYLVTFGIKPTRAETAYGYIHKGDSISESTGYTVNQFVEKPDLKTAEQYVASGKYFWNSGMFMFRASTFLQEIKKYSPDIFANCNKTYEHIARDLDFLRLNKEIFSACRSDSIDYAVMEKSDKVAMVALDAEWSDVGSWDALWEVKQPDKSGNVTQGDVHINQVKNSYLHAENRMLAVVGVTDHIVVETADAVLVAHKDYCQDVKSIVASLKNANRSEIDLHRKVYRPWGYYEVLDSSAAYQVKRILVKPGARLSLQSHKYRSEHWVVIAGVATVTRDDETLELNINQSTYIPVGVKHRLENCSNEPLIIIEVQCGSYIGEDDIVRFEDVYGRVEVSLSS